ncbi:MAG: hypothetical protein HY277_01750 [Ignavibacteriales bacterium]|nr:hypothetical protein [Ignavibacteriales bacterium]
MDHFSEKKFLGNIYARMEWKNNVEIDGNVVVKDTAKLTLSNNMTLTIDALDTLFVDGTLQIDYTHGNVTIAGPGVIKYGPSGKLNIIASVNADWNMVSVPDTVADFSKSAVYPTASSAAFSYSGTSGYQVQTSLNLARHWLLGSNSPARNRNPTRENRSFLLPFLSLPAGI